MKPAPTAKKTTHPVRYPLDALDRAEEFFEAFRQLPVLPMGRWISWPRYFLICHAVEMALKSFLASRGVPLEQLENRKLGHEIDQLVKLATSEGLDIGNTATELAKLGEAHSNHWARYPYDIGQPVFAVENFDPHVEKLIEAVSRAIRGRPVQTEIGKTPE